MSSPPEKKRKTTEAAIELNLLSLPDDLLFSCVARVPRQYYPTLSLVSKRFRSLLASPRKIYKVRSLSGLTESCVYVCFKCVHGYYRWYTLSRKLDLPGGLVLAKVPVFNSPPAHFSSLVAVGSKIYNIAGSTLDSPSSSSVSILDCLSHTWRKGPSLRVDLTDLSASVLDRKIYVAGMCIEDQSDFLKNAFEVFDTDTQVWDPEPIPCTVSQATIGYHYRTASIDGKFHVISYLVSNGLAYDSKEARWKLVGPEMGYHMMRDSFCEIDNVLYSTYRGSLRWYDTENTRWIAVSGLVGLHNLGDCVRLANYGGRLAVFWEYDLSSDMPSCGTDKDKDNSCGTDDDHVPSCGTDDDDDVFSCGTDDDDDDEPSCETDDDDEVPSCETDDDVDGVKMIWCAVIVLERRNISEIWGQVESHDLVLTVPTEYDLVKALAATL